MDVPNVFRQLMVTLALNDVILPTDYVHTKLDNTDVLLTSGKIENGIPLIDQAPAIDYRVMDRKRCWCKKLQLYF